MNNLHRFALCAALAASVGTTAAPKRGMAPPAGREVVISEFPLLPMPGPEGTWVELYNRSPAKIDIGQHHLTCNGKRLVTFPKPLVLPGRSLLLVRFAASHAKRWHLEEGAANSQVATVPALVADRGEATRVRPGFLALESPVKDGLDQLADYVRWGRFRLASDGGYHPRATKAGVWPREGGEPLYVGLSIRGKIQPLPDGEKVFSRLSFRPEFDQGAAWAILPMASASPGHGNLALPPPEPELLNGADVYAGDGLPVRCRLPVVPGQAGVMAHAVFRFQLARDPHFEEIVSTVDSKESAHVFPDNLVPPGGYYLRIRWLAPGIGTAWSPPLFLRAK